MRDKASENPYKRLRVVGTTHALVVSFYHSAILSEDAIKEVGKELMEVGVIAENIDMPLRLSFKGVQSISSALLGKLVLFNKRWWAGWSC